MQVTVSLRIARRTLRTYRVENLFRMMRVQSASDITAGVKNAACLVVLTFIEFDCRSGNDAGD